VLEGIAHFGQGERGVGVRVLVESRIFTSPCRPDGLWSPSSPHSKGYVGDLPWLKRPGRESDHSPPTNGGQENVVTYIHSPIHLHGLLLN
jgi:hypothetical protein